jgi:hypothetical protein
MASSALTFVAEFPTPAISVCSKPLRTYRSGFGLPASRAAAVATCAMAAGSSHQDQSAAQTDEFIAPADCHDCILGTACPLPKNCRQSQSAPSFKSIQPGPGCHANPMPRHRNVSRKWHCGGARPSRDLRRRLLRQRRPIRPEPGWHMAPAEPSNRAKAGLSIAPPARFPARVGWHCVPGRLPRQRVRGTPSGGSCLAS